MQIQIDWQEPIQLTHHRTILLDKNDLPTSIEELPGVYFFSRVHGSTIEPFYIGRSRGIRGRLKLHLRASKIREVLREVEEGKRSIKGGTRYFHYGYLKLNRGPSIVDSALALVERYLIRQALSGGLSLINEKGTKFKTHELTFTGSGNARGQFFGKGGLIPQK